MQTVNTLRLKEIKSQCNLSVRHYHWICGQKCDKKEITHTHTNLYWDLLLFLTATRTTGPLCVSQSANGLLISFFFSSLSLLQYKSKEEQGRNKWLKRRRGGKMLNVWVEGSDRTTYYSDVRLLTGCRAGRAVSQFDGPIGGGEMGPLMTSRLARHESCLHEGAFQWVDRRREHTVILQHTHTQTQPTHSLPAF